jgi:hypothetical protein
MKQFQLENHIGRSAIKAEINPKTAGKYIKGAAGPEEQPGERCWRTHPDAFAQVWPGVEEMLFREPQLQAKVIFEDLFALLRALEGVQFTHLVRVNRTLFFETSISDR